MTLRRDPSCLKDLVWRVELPGVDLEALAGRLMDAGWVERSRIPALRDLHDPDGHAVLFVPRTGRIQIRLHYLVRPEDRAAAAKLVYAWLGRQAQALSTLT